VPKIELLHIDCMEYMATLPDKAFELAIVDLEYGIGASRPSKKPNRARQKNGKMLSVKSVIYQQKDWDFKMSGAEYFEQLFRISINQIVWGGFYYGLAGGAIVWDKLNGETDQYDCEIAYQSFSKRTDLVYYMWSGMFQGEYCGKDIRMALKQIGNKSLNEQRIHPTQKPIALYKWLLHNYAKPGDRILDTHGGSRSLAIACHQMGFDHVSCELDKDYHEASVKRFKEQTSQLSLL